MDRCSGGAAQAAPPPLPNAHSRDTDLSNLILAWYHCGFFTAQFQERHGQQ